VSLSWSLWGGMPIYGSSDRWESDGGGLKFALILKRDPTKCLTHSSNGDYIPRPKE
jgi:hypothetical protein